MSGGCPVPDKIDGEIRRERCWTPPTGESTQFPLPTGDESRNGITAGPDGNLWFIDCAFGSQTSGCYKIGHITPTGKITEFPLPTAGYLEEITAGPDGNLWLLPKSVATRSGALRRGGNSLDYLLSRS